MALKFLNKKGWHTGSLRNIENVWKAEQKHDAEQKKLEELRKQIQEERERSEFRALQEQAGLVPRQERLEFLYDSGLAVGRPAGGTEGVGVAFKALEEETAPGSSCKNDDKQSSAPGALFEEKPHSANDTWRKLHSDPLLLIRQREQEALARLKNNPVQMALIRRSVEEKKPKEKALDKKESRKKHRHSVSKKIKHSSSKYHSDSEDDMAEEDERRKSGRHKTSSYKRHYDKQKRNSGNESRETESPRKSYHKVKDRERSPSYQLEWKTKDEIAEGGKGRKTASQKSSTYSRHHDKRELDSEEELRDTESYKKSYQKEKYRERSSIDQSKSKTVKDYGQVAGKENPDKSKYEKYSSQGLTSFNAEEKGKGKESIHQNESRNRQRNTAPKLSEEERAAKLREMQMDADLHNEQRWKRLKKAEEDDAKEAKSASTLKIGGKSFLDAAHRSVYGAEKGGSSTIEESVRRRTHYLQGRNEAERNAFRR